MSAFEEFQKIARLRRGCVITEKIDGTNAQVFIDNSRLCDDAPEGAVAEVGGMAIYAGSRSRWITPAQDNFGFAAWVKAHAAELYALGPGRHYGEWWGSGVNRGYGLLKGEKHFSLFNVARWHAVGGEPFETRPADPRLPSKFSTEAPTCCGTVPILYRGPFETPWINGALDKLQTYGSYAAKGFMKPEGIVIYHEAARQLFKVTLERDEQPKGTNK